MQTGPRFRLAPKIKLLLDARKLPLEPRLIDLAIGETDAMGQRYRIKRAHNPRTFDIDLKRYIRDQVLDEEES